MTVVAYKDGVIAADRCIAAGSMRRSGSKLSRLSDGRIVASVGISSRGEAMLSWLRRGAAVDAFPKSEDKDDFARLVVIDLDGNLTEYENSPWPQTNEDKFVAFGSGRDFAMGAMEMGADAVKAVQVASKHCIECGGGVDFYDIRVEERPYSAEVNGVPFRED